MSIRHVVTIHCDQCGNWTHADGQTTAQRERLGWRVTREQGWNANHVRHICPVCSGINPNFWKNY